MENSLNRENVSSLPEQIAGIIRQRIQRGLYTPGKKIDSIRKLSADLKVSPVTVLRALENLEKTETVIRLPGRGVFVSEKFQSKDQPLTACFAFPKLTPGDIRDAEGKALTNELYRGLMQGAMEENIKLQFSYFELEPSPEEFLRQVKEAEKYDFIIFANWQFKHLMEKVSSSIPAFTVRGSATEEFPFGVHVSDYDRPDARRKLFQLFLDSGCRSAAALTSGVNISARAKDFLRRVAEAGKITPDDGNWVFPSFDWDFDYDSALARLKKCLTREKPEFLFCNSINLLSLVYEAAYSLKLEIGQDIMVSGIASGLTVETIFPRYTYLKIPRYEQGVDIMRAASACIRLGVPVDLPVHKVRLVTGQTVNLRKTKAQL